MGRGAGSTDEPDVSIGVSRGECLGECLGEILGELSREVWDEHEEDASRLRVVTSKRMKQDEEVENKHSIYIENVCTSSLFP